MRVCYRHGQTHAGQRRHDPGHRVVGGQELYRHRAVPDVRAGRLPRRAVQGAEHVAQLGGDSGRARDRSRPGRAGRSRGGRARGRDEPGAAQAGGQQDVSASRYGQDARQAPVHGLSHAQEAAVDDGHRRARYAAAEVRRDRRGGRGESGRDQPEIGRHSQHGGGPCTRTRPCSWWAT